MEDRRRLVDGVEIVQLRGSLRLFGEILRKLNENKFPEGWGELSINPVVYLHGLKARFSLDTRPPSIAIRSPLTSIPS